MTSLCPSLLFQGLPSTPTLPPNPNIAIPDLPAVTMDKSSPSEHRETKSPEVRTRLPRFDRLADQLQLPADVSPTLSIDHDQDYEKRNRKLNRRIDIRILPLCCWVYLLNFLDRGNIGNSKVLNSETGDDLLQQTNMSASDYAITVTLFSLAYALFEVPSNWVMQHYVRPSLWLAILLLAWGALTIGFAGVHNYATVLALRFLIGVFEAGFFPGKQHLSSPTSAADLHSLKELFTSSPSGTASTNGLYESPLWSLSATSPELLVVPLLMVLATSTVLQGYLDFVGCLSLRASSRLSAPSCCSCSCPTIPLELDGCLRRTNASQKTAWLNEVADTTDPMLLGGRSCKHSSVHVCLLIILPM